ncbi:MAG: DUF3864 domain-containing protein, partial [Bacteroidales bacterium]|nr:DUF3864 domain-containing protein [Bacteroidales bacterium]
KKFRFATLRHGTKNEEPMVIDLTRYDLPASEPADATPDSPSRNWSLINRINQKHQRPEDRPVPVSSLADEEKALVLEQSAK